MTGVGGKAIGLQRLSSVVDVPPFITLSAGWISSRVDLSAALAERVAAAGLREPYAVRSSADAEDGSDASYAGMFETLLGIKHCDLAAAVTHVAHSAVSARVDGYMAALNLSDSRGAVHVVVQEMVPSEIAGVVFSRHTSIPDAVLIEAVLGVGDVLVGGGAQGERLTVDRDSNRVVTRVAGRQYIRIDVTGARFLLTGHEVYDERLTDAEAEQIAAVAVGLERHFPEAARGLDIEWAIANATLFCLQCRPITTECSPVT